MPELNPQDAKRLETLSVDARKVIGQAIIEGILKPRQIAMIDAVMDYTQGSGNYTQRGGGNYVQGGGNYNQAPKEISIGEQVMNIIRR